MNYDITIGYLSDTNTTHMSVETETWRQTHVP